VIIIVDSIPPALFQIAMFIFSGIKITVDRAVTKRIVFLQVVMTNFSIGIRAPLLSPKASTSDDANGNRFFECAIVNLMMMVDKIFVCGKCDGEGPCIWISTLSINSRLYNINDAANATLDYVQSYG